MLSAGTRGTSLAYKEAEDLTSVHTTDSPVLDLPRSTVLVWPDVYPKDPAVAADAALLPWIFECPNYNCTWRTAHKDAESAHKERERHLRSSCPYLKENTVPPGKSIIEKMWDELDVCTKHLIDNKPTDEVEDMETLREYATMRGKGQGLAVGIFLMSQPHFADVTAVAKWAGRRYKMQAGTMEHIDTPGCEGFNPMPLPAQTDAVKKPRGVKAAPDVADMTDQQVKLLTNGLNAGLPYSALAKLAKCSEPQVKEFERRLKQSS
jgi:hypothetical protein